MGASRSRQVADPPGRDRSLDSSPVSVVEFAAERLLRNSSPPDALPAVLQRLVTCFGAKAALAFQCSTAGKLVVLAAYPRQAAVDPALLAAISALYGEHQDTAAAGGSVQALLTMHGLAGDSPISALLAYPAPTARESPCMVAVAGDASSWNGQTQSATRAVASIVSAQIRHADDAIELAGRHALSTGLIKGAPDPIIAASADGRIAEFNPAAVRLFGLSREDVLGRHMTELMPPHERARFEQHAEVYLRDRDRGEYVGTVRVAIQRGDGTQRMAELTPVPLTIGGEIHFCGFLRDRTELEHAHAALAESETRFRLLAELAPVGIVQTDTAGRIVFVNDRWSALTGLTARDALSGSWTRALHPGDVQRVEHERAYAFEHGAELRTECRLRPTGRDEVWVNAAVVALAAPDGKPLGGIAAITNVSDRKRQQEERAKLLAAEHQARSSLADQTARLNGLIAAAIPGVLFADEHGVITQVNNSFCGLFGIAEKPGQLTGTPVADLVRRIKKVFDDPAEFIRRTSEALAQRQLAPGEQMACTDGRTLECDYWPVLVDGDYRGDLWLAWDVSDQKALAEQRERALEAELAARELAELAQQQLAEQNAQLRELDDLKTQYLATASHELRTPLISIVSFIEMIRRDDHGVTPDTEDSLDVIQRNAERLLQMVGELLLLSRIETGIMPLELAPVSVPALIEEAAKSSSPGATRRGIMIEVSAQDGPRVQGDGMRLRQVLDNLLSNAVKFSRQDGHVRVTATCDDAIWRIDVEDSGIGIPASELGQIFDRFVRASNARTAGLPGTGLGLSVVKAITELHGGRIEARSTVGSGTTFRVSLPLCS